MPTPPPDPNGPLSPAPGVPASAPVNPADAVAAARSREGSTGSHHPSSSGERLSDLIHKSGSSRKVPVTGQDLLHMLAHPGASPIVAAGGSGAEANSDDAPTIITRSYPTSPPPLPLPDSGDVPTIAGRRLGHFELIEAIGAGGMAAVLKARDLELGRIVALKILPPETARDAEGIGRFKQEARAAALLDHENIARVYFCGEDQGLHFIAFEFVEGENLRQLIDRHETLPADDCVRYMIQIAAGLNHAAERGVVHRDIKPSNIIITPDGRAKIVDMGLARHLDAEIGGVTHSGVTLGTFDYISPEQALDPRRADIRSDIYSLGCAFYHALTGRAPVPEGTAAKKLQAHQQIEPLDPREINPAIPDDLAAVLAHMMAKNPGERYQSPAELISHLKGIAERLKISLEVVASDTAVKAVKASPALPTEPPSLRLGWAIAAAAIVIAVAAFVLSPGSGSRPGPPPWEGERAGKIADPQLGTGGGLAPIPHPTAGVVAVRSAKELADALAEANTNQVHLEAGTYDLTELAEGVEYSGTKLHLKGSTTDITRVIVYAGDHVANGRGSPGSLVLRAEDLTVEWIRFEIRTPPPAGEFFGLEGNPSRPAGLSVHIGTRFQLADCAFTWKEAMDEDWASIAVTAAGEARPISVNLSRCSFPFGKGVDRGGVALQVPPRAKVDIDDSGFGPHGAAVLVAHPPAQGTKEPEGTAAAATVRLHRSSFMLDSRGAVVESATPVEVSAGYCLFASVVPEPASIPAVLRLARPEGSKLTEIPGKKNVYFQTNPLIAGPAGSMASLTFEECKSKYPAIADAGAAALAQVPWTASRPTDVLADQEPWRAYLPKLTETALFLKDRDPDVRVIGVQFHDRDGVRRAFAHVGWPPPPPASTTGEPRTLVWYPFPKEGEKLEKDTFTGFAALLETVRGGETILIRHDGLLALKNTIEFEKPRGNGGDIRLTIKPYTDSKPILAPSPDSPKLDQALFRLLGGEVAFEDIQFLLKPTRPMNPQVVSAVAVVGGKGCTFTRCVFTLLEEDEAKSTAVLVADPSNFMVMDPRDRPVPEVKFEKCVLRGKGRGVSVPVSRAVRADVANSLVALDGPLYTAKPEGKAVAGARSLLKLTNVTAFVGGPLVDLRGAEKVGAMGTSGLVPMDVEVNSCLLAGMPNAGVPLVHLHGVEPGESEQVISWKVQAGNRYANFDSSPSAMIVQPAGDGSTPKLTNWNKWLTFAREPAGNPIGTVMFEKGPAGLGDLAALKPADATVKKIDFPDLPEARPGDTGVDLKVLPPVWDHE